MLKLTLILFLLVLAANSFAQQYPFIQYTPKDGLVYNRCRSMLQDSKGLLYIATYSGLSVYDGCRFTNYTTREGLQNNFIEDMVEMGEDSIWIISNEGPIQYLRNGRIHNLGTIKGNVPGITKMIQLKNGQWYALADEGLFLFSKNKFSKIDFTNNKNGKEPYGYFANAVEWGSKLFITTDWHTPTYIGAGRIIVYDFITKRVQSSKSLNAYDIVVSPSNEVLVTIGSGIKQIDIQALVRDSIVLKDLPPVYHAAGQLNATNMYFDRQHNLWVGANNGLVRIDSTGNSTIFTRENGLPVNVINSIFQDKENTMWFVNEQTGICKLTNSRLERYKNLQKNFFVTDIYADKDSLWMLDAGSKRLLLHNNNRNTIIELPKQLLSPPYRFFATEGNSSWLTDLFNIYQCNLSSGHTVQLKRLYADSNRNENASFSCIKPDHYGNLLATSEKLIVLLKNGRAITYPLAYYSDGMALAPGNMLWVVTRSGILYLFQIHPEDPGHYLQLLKIFDHELPRMAPRSIAVDNIGRVWIGTRDAGMYGLLFHNMKLQSVQNITTRAGLSDNFISHLEADQDGSLYACSPVGFDKLSFSHNKIQVENITLSNEIYQHIFKSQVTSNGINWLMSTGEILRVSPEEVTSHHFRANIMFRQISQDTNYVDPVLPGNFKYDNNNLVFLVAAPSFIEERRTRFSYLLQGGGQTSWSNPSAQGLINLVNLSSGKYTLHIKAIFANNGYADTEIAYSFIIHPPWWKTWWFNTLLVLVAGLSIVFIIRNYYRARFRKKQAIFEKEQAIEKERSRIATDMHDDLGAGLSTIRFLSEKIKQDTAAPFTKTDIDKIQNTSNELIDKMNEIIWSMNERNNSLEDLVFFIRSYAMEYCENNSLSCNIELPDIIPAIVVSGETRRNVFLTVKESLHNIVKHAQAGTVRLTIHISDSLTIVLKDNGKGIGENWKTAGGNGLKNMQKRMSSIGGSLQILNDGGVCTTIQLPLVGIA